MRIGELQRADFYRLLSATFAAAAAQDERLSDLLQLWADLGLEFDAEKAREVLTERAQRPVTDDLLGEIPEHVRRSFPQHLRGFYRNCGYELSAEAEPDTPVTMLAFIATLVSDEEAEVDDERRTRLRRMEHRFLRVHLLPALRAMASRLDDSGFLSRIADLVELDAEGLKAQLAARRGNPTR